MLSGWAVQGGVLSPAGVDGIFEVSPDRRLPWEDYSALTHHSELSCINQLDWLALWQYLAVTDEVACLRHLYGLGLQAIDKALVAGTRRSADKASRGSHMRRDVARCFVLGATGVGKVRTTSKSAHGGAACLLSELLLACSRQSERRLRRIPIHAPSPCIAPPLQCAHWSSSLLRLIGCLMVYAHPYTCPNRRPSFDTYSEDQWPSAVCRSPPPPSQPIPSAACPEPLAAWAVRARHGTKLRHKLGHSTAWPQSQSVQPILW